VAAIDGRPDEVCPPLAHLRPASPALAAHSAAGVVVDHDPVAHSDRALVDSRARGRDDSARLVPGDDAEIVTEVGRTRAERSEGRIHGPAVELEIAAAHAGGLDLHHNLARSGYRVVERGDLNLAITTKNHATHCSVLLDRT